MLATHRTVICDFIVDAILPILTEFEKERRQIVALCLIQDSIDYFLFHYIVEADAPKRAWNILE